MKALYITHLYFPRHVGGTETYTHALARGVIGRGHQAQVLCAEDWGRGDRYWNGHVDDLVDGVAVRKLRLNWTKAPDVNRPLYDNAIVADYVRKYVGEAQPDIVHVTSCNTLSASVIEAVKQARVPLIVSLTDYWFLCPRVTLVKGDGALCDGRVPESECVRCLLHRAKAYRWPRYILSENLTIRLLSAVSQHGRLTRYPGLRGMAMDIRDRRARVHRALQQADRVLIASPSARELFQRNGFSMPIEVVPYGHDLSWLSHYAGKTQRRLLSFGFIGQISPMKGPQLLIEAFKSVAHNSQARLLIFGDMEKDPEFGQRLRSMATGRSDIEFRGTYSHAEVGRVFAEIDVLVVPSLWNDFPLIINEAFAAKTPVIATDLGGMSELVQHEVNGLLFARGSVEDLARMLGRAIAEHGLLTRLRIGIPPVKTMDDALDEMMQIYRDTLSTVPSPYHAC